MVSFSQKSTNKVLRRLRAPNNPEGLCKESFIESGGGTPKEVNLLRLGRRNQGLYKEGENLVMGELFPH